MAVKEQKEISATDVDQANIDINSLITPIQKLINSPHNPAYKVDKHGQREKGVKFYEIQSLHILLPLKIGYVITDNLRKHQSWVTAITRAVDIINKRCPGITIKEDQNKKCDRKLEFDLNKIKGGCHTKYNFIYKDNVYIKLDPSWKEKNRDGTALHELLHALGFLHTQQRKDAAENGVTINEANGVKKYKYKWAHKWEPQYASKDKVVGIVMYDPNSIMHYHNKEPCIFDVDKHSWTVYASKSQLFGHGRINVLSPLDELGINLLYRPIERMNYSPVRGKITGLYYCGRSVMKGHNYPGKDVVEICGPNAGPNCSACRVLQNRNIPKKNEDGVIVWQGSSGAFYCGREVDIGYGYPGNVVKPNDGSGWDGFCGPNNGPSCAACYELIQLNNLDVNTGKYKYFIQILLYLKSYYHHVFYINIISNLFIIVCILFGLINISFTSQ